GRLVAEEVVEMAHPGVAGVDDRVVARGVRQRALDHELPLGALRAGDHRIGRGARTGRDRHVIVVAIMASVASPAVMAAGVMVTMAIVLAGGIGTGRDVGGAGDAHDTGAHDRGAGAHEQRDSERGRRRPSVHPVVDGADAASSGASGTSMASRSTVRGMSVAGSAGAVSASGMFSSSGSSGSSASSYGTDGGRVAASASQEITSSGSAAQS